MRAIIFTVTTLLLSCTASAQDMQEYMEKFGIDKNASFSGTRHMEMKEGQLESFVRQDGEKMRMEMNYGGMPTVVITRPDLGKYYMLMTSMSMYREVDAGEIPGGANDMNFSEASKVGRETINGYDCNKIKAKFKDKEGGKGGGYYWVSDEGILMKVDMIYQSRKQKGQRMVFEMRDVEIGPQDPSEFEVPANYSSMSFGAMMGQNPQMQGNSGQPYEEQSLGEEIADDAKNETEQAVKDESRKSIRKGLKKLFD